MAEIAGNHIIYDCIHEWDTPYVEQAIFGTGDSEQIAQQLHTFCLQILGNEIAEILFYESSQGAVCGLRLDDGRRVVVKGHQPDRTLDFLQAVYRVQRYLAEHDYPCPLPLAAPAPLGNGYAIVEQLIDEGSYVDAHNSTIRSIMAEYLAKLTAFTDQLGNLSHLSLTAVGRTLPPSVLWPIPHSKIFDFEATKVGAEWIDALARQAREILAQGVGQQVIGHSDYSVKHFRFIDGKVRVIYDWDSLGLNYETVLVGETARAFTMTWHLPVHITPSPDEARAFVAEYEQARGKTFSTEEWRTISAAATYALAYSARCGHCFTKSSDDFSPGSPLEALACYGANYLHR